MYNEKQYKTKGINRNLNWKASTHHNPQWSEGIAWTERELLQKVAKRDQVEKDERT